MKDDISKNRLNRLQTEMARQEVGLAAIAPTANMRYLIGFAPRISGLTPG